MCKLSNEDDLILTKEQEDAILEIAMASTDFSNRLEEGTFYRYTGPPAQREFCVQMMAFNKLYSKQDINMMSFQGINGKFAKKGTRNYSIFKYRGGAYCKHVWREIEVRMDEDGLPYEYDRGVVDDSPVLRLNLNEDEMYNKDVTKIYEYYFDEDLMSGIETISLVENPATQIIAVQMSEQEDVIKVEFKTVDEEERILVSPILIPNQLIYRNNVNGEPSYVFASADTISKLQENFVIKGHQSNSNIEHNGTNISGITFTEQWIVRDSNNDTINAYGFKDIPVGSWCVKAKLSQSLWDDYIKSGKIKGFSVEGMLGVTPSDLNDINKTKINIKMNKETINQIVLEAIRKVALNSDLNEFKDADGNSYFSNELVMGAIVTDADGNLMMDLTFTIDGKNYTTDEMGAIKTIEDVVIGDAPVDTTVADIQMNDAPVDAPVDTPNDLEAKNIELESKVVELEAKVADLEAKNIELESKVVIAEDQVVEMSKQTPASKGFKNIQVNHSSNNKKESMIETLNRLRK